MRTQGSVKTVVARGGHLGADVVGVDLRHPLDPATVSELRSALAEHLVLFFPGQFLDDAQQLRFAQYFGSPYVHPLGRGSGREGRCERIVDDLEHPPYQDKWHTDVSWDDAPPTYGTLRAIDMPTRGGDTIWSSMYAAYDSLSPTMQACVASLEAVHTMGSATSFVSKAGSEAVARVRAQFPGAVHPVVALHPLTGRRYLNVNREFTETIVGMHPDESRVLLDLLTSRAMDPNFQLRYSWNVGDVAIWDERCTQHFAVADYLPQRREMGRVAVITTDEHLRLQCS
jgi:taurine dioxygenase